MEENVKQGQGNIGIKYCLFFGVIFLVIAMPLRGWCKNWEMGVVVDGLERLIFGLIELYVFVKVFQKSGWRDVLHFKNYKKALAACAGIFLCMGYLVAVVVFYAASFSEMSLEIIIFILLFQQITTGFFEEMNFRAFLLEGYYQNGEYTWKRRLSYALLSFGVFGAIHIIGCETLSIAASRFLMTGAIGFVFAVSYLYSHNIIIPMLLHFAYDVCAHLGDVVEEWRDITVVMKVQQYVYPVLLIVAVGISLFFIFKKQDELY